MQSKILIVEDESLVALEISSALKKEDYIITAVVDNAEEALQSIKNDMPDLVMMDININGDINGVELAAEIKYDKNIPIIFLTAYEDKETIDKAVQTFPSAYLIKPFSRKELYANVRVALAQSSKKTRFTNGAVYNPASSEVLLNEKVLSLSPNEKLLLDLLISNKNKIVTFGTIENEVWQDGNFEVTTRRTLIFRLRKKIGAQSIETKKDQGLILKI